MKCAFIKIALLFFGSLIHLNCVPSLIKKTLSQDQLYLTVAAGSLFTQQHAPPDKNWAGDWMLRRERLRLIDAEFNRMQPDILILQEVLAKTSSAYDSDHRILSAGSLADFSWSSSSQHYFSESDEEEFMVLAAKQGLLKERSISRPQQYLIGQDGVLVLHSLALANQEPLTIGNLYLPSSVPTSEEIIDQLREHIDQFLSQQSGCRERLLLGGLIMDAGSENLKNFLANYQLVDNAEEFCQTNDCITPSRENNFFSMNTASAPQVRSQSTRIFLPDTSTSTEAGLVFAKSQESSLFSSKYHFTQLWPTARLGWMIRAKFARCR
jgi:hypothetical protein